MEGHWIWYFLCLAFLIWETKARIQTYMHRPVRFQDDASTPLMPPSEKYAYHRLLSKIWFLGEQNSIHSLRTKYHLASVQGGRFPLNLPILLEIRLGLRLLGNYLQSSLWQNIRSLSLRKSI